MKTIKEKAYAKLNLSLDIISKMDDGYHAMKMVMQSAGLCDEISLSETNSKGIAVRTNLSYLPKDDRNIAVKAADMFMEETGVLIPGLFIDIQKNIPVCAGLGGGSSDGAAVLRAMNALTGAGLSAEELMAMGSRLGSDVPFCVAGGTALATGKGEVLSPLPPLPPCSIVICKPEFSISTPKLFSRINCSKMHHHPDTDGIIKALNAEDLTGVSRRMYNVFEEVLPEQFSDVGLIKAKLLDCRALGVSMSGTGSAVFGLFDSYKCAQTAYQLLSKDYSACFLTRPIGRLM